MLMRAMMLPSGSLNQADFAGPMTWMSPFREAPAPMHESDKALRRSIPTLARIIHDSDLLFHLRAVHARHLPLLIN